jgi:hypothetical protein
MILDHVEKLELDQLLVNTRANEMRSLAYLGEGLQFLYLQVKRMEETVSSQIDPNLRVQVFGNHPLLKSVPLGMVACAFHWYSVSACNYARLVGWLGNDGDTGKADEYVRRVIPSVRLWRNKVAAHFAATDPRPEDTPADLAMSVIFPVSFDDDAFYANSLTLSLRRSGSSSSSRTDMKWSLTHTHRELTARYWPATQI